MIQYRSLRSMGAGLLLLLFLVSSGFAQTAIPGEAIVKITAGNASKSVLNHPGIVVYDSIPNEQTYLVKFDGSSSVTGVVKMLTKNPHVEFAQPNHKYELPEVQQVSIGFPDQGHPIFSMGTNPPTYYAQPGIFQTGIDSAQLLASGAGITVAVVDNGLDLEHPLIRASHVLAGYDFVGNDNNPSEELGTMYGHGTFVTGLILLAAPDCNVIPLRAFNGEGVGSEFDAAKAIRRAIDMGANIINLSFGTPEEYPVLTNIVNRALNAGIVMVASSGNYGSTTPIYPAACRGVISVGAINERDVVADFSSYGPTLDLVAPGVDVYSCLAGDYEWGTWSGTSFSAPIVSGAIALVLQRSGPLGSETLEKHMRLTARTEMLWGMLNVPDAHYGWGALDAYSAVAEVAKGDLDNSGVVDATDLRILHSIVYPESTYTGRPVCRRQCDIDCSGVVDKNDIQALADYLFYGGPAPHRCSE